MTLTPEEEAERAHDLLSGVTVLKCEVCKEAIPWKSQIPVVESAKRDGPYWAFAHESGPAGFPNCISKLSGMRISEENSSLWSQWRAGQDVFIKPSEEQLDRVRRVNQWI